MNGIFKRVNATRDADGSGWADNKTVQLHVPDPCFPRNERDSGTVCQAQQTLTKTGSCFPMLTNLLYLYRGADKRIRGEAVKLSPPEGMDCL